MSECYQYNQAMEFLAKPSFPGYDSLSGVIARNVLSDDPLILDWSSVPTIYETVKFPPIKVLRSLPASDLLDRRNVLGPQYFSTLRTWQQKPTDANAKELRKALREYSKGILDWTVQNAPQFSNVFLEVVAGAGTTPGRRFFSQLLTGGGAIASVYQPWVAPLVVLGPLGFAAYLWKQLLTEDTPIQIKAAQNATYVPPEVILPNQRQ